MSLESAKEFIERMKTDEEFAKQVASRKDKEERMKFVSEQGFNFSEQEVQQVAKEFSDDDLEKVVGGSRSGRGYCLLNPPLLRLPLHPGLI